jgi:hypothetical protein
MFAEEDVHESGIFVISLRRVFISYRQRNVIVLSSDEAITPGAVLCRKGKQRSSSARQATNEE